jgi:hypothetical protein
MRTNKSWEELRSLQVNSTLPYITYNIRLGKAFYS